MKLSIHPLASREADDAADWYERRREGLGESFTNSIVDALRLIAERPLAWPSWPEDPTVRLKVVRRFPYVIAFRVGSNEVRILALAHDKRQRGYWRDR